MALAADLTLALSQSIAVAGVSGTFGRAKDAAGTPGITMRFLMKHPSVRDEAIINSYGVSAQIITIPATPVLVANPPEKFDHVDQGGARYVFDAVIARTVSDVVIAWTAYVRGKGA